MGKLKNVQISEFQLEGRFLGFEVEDGYKIKYLRLATAEGESCLKLAKEARAALSRQMLTPGDWVQVGGEKKLELETGKLKLKIYQVMPAAPSPSQTVIPVTATVKQPSCILVCQKSDCCKKGAMEVCQVLTGALRDRGLENQVKIKGTGCMKQCKAGPNIVMPDKTTYRRVEPAEIPDLIEKHFTAEANPKERVAERALVR